MFKLQQEASKRSMWLVGDSITLGSNSNNDWVLHGLGIEAFHAEIAIHTDYLLLKRAGGRCFVNDSAIEKETQLASGDVLRFGNERLQVIDPKRIVETETPSQAIANSARETPVAPVVKSWSLLPGHPKLKQIDFTITRRSVLGRSKKCDFSIPYKMLSSEHASFTVVGNELVLQALGAANSCFVNGKQITKATLKGGDQVSFAKLSFTVMASTAVQTKPVKTSDPFLNQHDTNKTVIRPAVDIEAELAKGNFDQAHKKETVSAKFEKQLLNGEKQNNKLDSFSRNRWQLMSFIGISVILAVWFSPLSPW